MTMSLFNIFILSGLLVWWVSVFFIFDDFILGGFFKNKLRKWVESKDNKPDTPDNTP